MGYLDPSGGCPASLVGGGSTRKPVESVTSLQPRGPGVAGSELLGAYPGPTERLHTQPGPSPIHSPLPPLSTACSRLSTAAATLQRPVTTSPVPRAVRETKAQLETTVASRSPERCREARARLGSAQKPSEGSPLHAGPQMTGLETTCFRNSEPRASRGPQGPAYIPSPSPKASSHHSPRVPALTLAGSAALPSMDSLSPQFHPVLWVWHVLPRPGPALSWLPAHCNTFPRDPRPPHSCP